MSRITLVAQRQSALARRQRVLDFVRDFTAQEGWSPTFREIADYTGVSRETVHLDVCALVEAGKLRRAEREARTLVVIDGAYP